MQYFAPVMDVLTILPCMASQHPFPVLKCRRRPVVTDPNLLLSAGKGWQYGPVAGARVLGPNWRAKRWTQTYGQPYK